MRTNSLWLKWIVKLGMILIMGVSMSACSATSWKEEVLLHDGSKLIVRRTQGYGGRGEIGQGAPIKEQGITFTVPSTGKTITFESEYSEDVGRANFLLLALHILDGTPYIVAEPNLCLSYNKWGRPNPPYVFFRYDGTAWQRIPLSEFPAEFKDINLAIETKSYERIQIAVARSGRNYLPAEFVKGFNSELTQSYFKTILREAMPENANCPQYSSSPKAPIPIKPRAIQ